ncbi:MAG: RDD family protein [Elusimicrobiaceae bacterium]|nr:RDD family protein [Elusimicrobiaceae bacterium]
MPENNNQLNFDPQDMTPGQSGGSQSPQALPPEEWFPKIKPAGPQNPQAGQSVDLPGNQAPERPAGQPLEAQLPPAELPQPDLPEQIPDSIAPVPDFSAFVAQSEPETANAVRYATLNSRFVASVIDGIILLIVEVVLKFTGVPSLVSFVASALYFTLFDSSDKMATPGKMLLKIQVIGATGGRLSFGRAFMRYFLIAAVFPLVYGTALFLSKAVHPLIVLPVAIAGIVVICMPGFTRYKQGLHDKMLNTFVVYK